MLNVSNLTVQYGQHKVVNNVSFSIEKGKVLGIAGGSGSGKTTLALAIPGLLSHQAQVSGHITVHQLHIPLHQKQQLSALNGKQIGFVFQEPSASLNPLLSCGVQITETITALLGQNPKTAVETAKTWLKRVQIQDIERVFNAYPHELSGGQLQRICIAMALCGAPTLLIADEPTTALDTTVQKSILDLLKQLQVELQLTMLFISHDQKVLRYMADELVVMNQGEMSPLEAAMPDNETAQKHSTAQENLVFEQKGITVRYPAEHHFWGKTKHWKTAVNHVDMAVYQGECVGIVGESGSGKSSLGQAVAAAMGHAKGGAVLIDQHPGAALNPIMPVGHAVLEAFLHFNPMVKNAEGIERTQALLQSIGLDPSIYHRLPAQLSGGQKQRICIARALTAQPKLLSCDEIISGLDLENQRFVLDLLQQLKAEKNLSILFITHDLDIVRSISDRILVLHDGVLVEAQATSALFSHPQHPYTKTLLAARL